jgi:hypothetical protein
VLDPSSILVLNQVVGDRQTDSGIDCATFEILVIAPNGEFKTTYGLSVNWGKVHKELTTHLLIVVSNISVANFA